MDELKPCPFCGESNQQVEKWYVPDPQTGGVYHQQRWYTVECCSCGATGPDDSSASGAREAWNVLQDKAPSAEDAAYRKSQDDEAIKVVYESGQGHVV